VIDVLTLVAKETSQPPLQLAFEPFAPVFLVLAGRPFAPAFRAEDTVDFFAAVFFAAVFFAPAFFALAAVFFFGAGRRFDVSAINPSRASRTPSATRRDLSER
jgi:hypothetical protein